MVNFMNPLESEERGYPLSHFYNIDHTMTNLVCMCRSTPALFTEAILPNILLIWLPWQPSLLAWHCTKPKYYIDLKTLMNRFFWYY